MFEAHSILLHSILQGPRAPVPPARTGTQQVNVSCCAQSQASSLA